MRDPRYAVLRRSRDVTHASGAAAWTKTRTARAARWALRPTLGEGGEGRRLLVEATARTSIFVAKPDERARAVFRDLGADVGHLAFSPEGERLAFAAGRGGYHAVYVVGLDGRVLAGNARALSSGAIPEGDAVTGLTWDATGRWVLARSARPGGGEVVRRVSAPPPRTPRTPGPHPRQPVRRLPVPAPGPG